MRRTTSERRHLERGRVTQAIIGTAVLTLALAGPVLALDPRCDQQPDRPFCQPAEEPAPTTTTTLPQVTTTTASAPLPTDPLEAISVIGCSNTNHATAGYLAASSNDVLVNTAAAGHTVEYWATEDAGWSERYLPMRPVEGYDGAWLNLCERAANTLTIANAEAVLAKIWEIDPGIPVWISPLNYYETEACLVTAGNLIPSEGAIIADALVAQYEDVFRGPDLGPLGDALLRADECHPNQAGIAFLGAQLVDFFDALAP